LIFHLKSPVIREEYGKKDDLATSYCHLDEPIMHEVRLSNRSFDEPFDKIRINVRGIFFDRVSIDFLYDMKSLPNGELIMIFIDNV